MMPGMPSRDSPRGSRETFDRRGGESRGNESSYEENEERSEVVDVPEVRGVDRARMRLVPWFRRVVDSVEQEVPLDVTLCQVAHAAGQQPVTTIPYEFDTPVEKAINELLMIAVDDMMEAEFRGAKITYSIIVELQNGKIEKSNFVLEMPRRRALDDPPRLAHFPDDAGIKRHLLEQNLQLTEFSLESASAGKDILLQMIQDLREENRLLKRHQFERDRQIQMMMDGNLKRTMLVEEHRAKIDRDTKIADGFKSLAPALLPLVLPSHIAQAFQQLAPQAPPSQQAQGLPMSADADLIDDLILELEQDQEFFMKLFTLMGEKPRCFQILHMLHQGSAARREARARAQVEESARRDGERAA